MSFLHAFEQAIRNLAETLPLDVFVGVAAFIEEFFPPIPVSLVGTLAGSIALARGEPWIFIIGLALVASLAKTLASWILYVLGDRLEDVLLHRFGKYLGVTHEQAERFGARFSGDWRDDIVLLALRIAPVVPTTPLSLAAGAVKIDRRSFLWTTLVGLFFRNLIFLGIGFGGWAAIREIVLSIEQSYLALVIIIGAACLGALALVLLRRLRNRLPPL